MLGCECSAWLGWQWQGQAAEPFQAESSSYGAYSARKPCHCLPYAEKASGNGNKRLTGNQKKSEERLTDEAEYWCFICKPFLFLFAVIFIAAANHRADGKLRSFKKIR